MIEAGFEVDLGDAGEFAANFVAVARGGCAELMEVDLLIKALIGGRALAGGGVARVKEAAAIGVPSDTAAAGRELHARNSVGQFFSSGSFEDIHGSGFAAF